MSQTLPNLPNISFSELDPAAVESSIITVYESVSGSTLFPGNPVRLFLESLAYIISMQNAAIDAAGKQNLLAYAMDTHLDHLGQLMDTGRMAPAPAMTCMRFSLAEPLPWAVLIPQGSRVTTGNNGVGGAGGLVFATDHSAEIAAGALFVEVPSTCVEAGLKGNGLVPGQINKMVDVIAYIKDVRNVSVSMLGADREGDESYRGRIQLAPEKFSVAGPSGAYRFHTLTVHQDIADCAVWCPIPGTVDIRPILKGGELPPEDLLAAVREHLNDDRIRPLTDTVVVAAPEPVDYAIAGGWTLRRASAPLAESIKQRVNSAVEEYRLWQRSLPGRDINPTRLVALLERAGAKRVQLDSPVFTKLHARQIARESAISIEFLGVEDE